MPVRMSPPVGPLGVRHMESEARASMEGQSHVPWSPDDVGRMSGPAGFAREAAYSQTVRQGGRAGESSRLSLHNFQGGPLNLTGSLLSRASAYTKTQRTVSLENSKTFYSDRLLEIQEKFSPEERQALLAARSQPSLLRRVIRRIKRVSGWKNRARKQGEHLHHAVWEYVENERFRALVDKNLARLPQGLEPVRQGKGVGRS